MRSAAAAAALKSKRSPTTLRFKHEHSVALSSPLSKHFAPAISPPTPEHCDLSFCLESQNVTQHDRSLDDESPRLHGREWDALKKTPHLCKPQRMGVAECGSNSPSFVKGPA